MIQESIFRTKHISSGVNTYVRSEIFKNRLKFSFSKESEILELGTSIERRTSLTTLEALSHAPLEKSSKNLHK